MTEAAAAIRGGIHLSINERFLYFASKAFPISKQSSNGRLHLITILWFPITAVTWLISESWPITAVPFLIGVIIVVRIFTQD